MGNPNVMMKNPGMMPLDLGILDPSKILNP